MTDSISIDILLPTDWQIVGERPEFYINFIGTPSIVNAFLFEKKLFFAHELKYFQTEYKCFQGDSLLISPLERWISWLRWQFLCLTQKIISFPVVPSEVQHLYIGFPQRKLPERDYVAVIASPDLTDVYGLVGIRVRPKHLSWEQHFITHFNHRKDKYAIQELLDNSSQSPVFSIITTVYNTSSFYLKDLFGCLQNQDFKEFEWLILDNGSNSEETIQYLRSISKLDQRIKLWRVEDNIHIIPGNRYLFERARGEYIIPCDSDDIVYPDALKILFFHIKKYNCPELVYSDEQKVSPLGDPIEFIWRPKWSNLFAFSTCPASHLMAFRRDLAVQASVYTSDHAKGSHDWDTALRLMDFGITPIHVPEVLYGWRIHAASTAGREAAKSYVGDSQAANLQETLKRRGFEEKFVVQPARANLGYYHLVRQPIDPPEVKVLFLYRNQPEISNPALLNLLENTCYPNFTLDILYEKSLVSQEELEKILLKKPTSGFRQPQLIACEKESDFIEYINASPVIAENFTAVVGSHLFVRDVNWIWDAVGTLELDEHTGIVGGCITKTGDSILHIGYIAGLDGFFATPTYGMNLAEAFGFISSIRRNVTAVYGSFTLVRNHVLTQVGYRGIDNEDGIYGVDFCLRCRDLGILTAFTPRMFAESAIDINPRIDSDKELIQEIFLKYESLLVDDPYYSQKCSLDSSKYGCLSSLSDRMATINQAKKKFSIN